MAMGWHRDGHWDVKGMPKTRTGNEEEVLARWAGMGACTHAPSEGSEDRMGKGDWKIHR